MIVNSGLLTSFRKCGPGLGANLRGCSSALRVGRRERSDGTHAGNCAPQEFRAAWFSTLPSAMPERAEGRAEFGLRVATKTKVPRSRPTGIPCQAAPKVRVASQRPSAMALRYTCRAGHRSGDRIWMGHEDFRRRGSAGITSAQLIPNWILSIVRRNS